MKSIAVKRCRTAPGEPRQYKVRRSELETLKKGTVLKPSALAELCDDQEHFVTVHA